MFRRLGPLSLVLNIIVCTPLLVACKPLASNQNKTDSSSTSNLRLKVEGPDISYQDRCLPVRISVRYGNNSVAINTQGIFFDLSSTSSVQPTVYFNSDCSTLADSTDYVIAPGLSERVLYYKVSSGSGSVGFSASGHELGGELIGVGGGFTSTCSPEISPHDIVLNFIGNSVVADTCTMVTAGYVDRASNAAELVNTDVAISIQPSSLYSDGAFFSDSQCAVAASTVTLPANVGTSDAIYYKPPAGIDPTQGRTVLLRLTATYAGQTSDTYQLVSVVAE